MKVYIANNLVDGPYGGGNQFLKFLRDRFKTLNVYSEDPLKATVILFNSHQNVEEVYHLKKQNPSATFVHRLDGPMRLYNNMEDTRDMTAYQMNTAFADAVVFQSHWSKQANLKLGLNIDSKRDTVIHNATNKAIFIKNEVEIGQKRIRIIASSWSNNVKKGFLTYQFLDRNLDFSKFELMFMGRSPIEFTNITNLGPLEAKQVAEELRKSDIYITASENDPCSNSLLEALSSGLPALALKSGGHPELVGAGGLLYEKEEEIINKLQQIWDNHDKYRSGIKTDSIEDVTEKYLSFFKKCKSD